jgi:DNA repair protein RecO
MEEKTQGILLHCFAYLGRKKILKVLTQDSGLLTFMAQNERFPTTPFCLAEWVFFRGQKEIYSLKDATLLDPLLELRQDYHVLSAAGSMAQNLLQTQMPNKKAPFHLSFAYFKKLPLNPTILQASFQLKLLLFEGLLSPERPSLFTEEEWEQVSILAFGERFSLIQEVKEAPFSKIQSLFKERFGIGMCTERDSNP